VTDVVAYIGLDWADERHSVHLQTADGRIEHVELEQKPAVVHAWVAQLQERFGGGQIASGSSLAPLVEKASRYRASAFGLIG